MGGVVVAIFSVPMCPKKVIIIPFRIDHFLQFARSGASPKALGKDGGEGAPV
jgi:hypothetical protein